MGNGRPRATVLTPEGRGAVASLVVEGQGAMAAVAGLFSAANGQPLDAQPLNRIVFGRWSGSPGEELIVCRRGPDRVEIHCHGGWAAVEAIRASLADRGCELTDWRTWLYGGGRRLETLAAETLTQASTQRTAAILLDQQQGALRRAIERAQTALAESNAAAVSALDELLRHRAVGLHLTEPYRVVLTGPANVGKSSLINALLGFRRSIVCDQPGTTRDVLTASTAVDGWPIELTDTAGLRENVDELETQGIERALRKLGAADLVVLVLDATQPIEPALLSPSVRDRCLVVYNKCDLLDSRAIAQRPIQNLATSALTGDGIERLIAALASRLVPDPPPPGAAVPFAGELIARLAEARDAIAAGRRDQAVQCLQALLS
jgi:tRNA modification GTPase